MIPESSPAETVGIVVYVTPALASARSHSTLEAIGQESVLARLVRTLADFLGDRNCPVTVLVHGPACGPVPLEDRVRSALSGSGADVFISREVSCLAALASLIRVRGHDSLAVYSSCTVFPVREMFHTLLRSHGQQQADATWAPAVPTGLVPHLYRGSALTRLYDWRLPDDLLLGADPATVMQKANGIMTPQDGSRFRLNQVFFKDDLSSMPSLLIDSPGSREAAERALEWSDGTKWDRISMFARELQTRETRIWSTVPLRSTTPEQPVGRRVLYATLARGLAGAEVSFSRLIVAGAKRSIAPVVSVPAKSAFTERLEAAGIFCEIAEHDIASLNRAAFLYYSDLLTRHSIDLVHIDSFGMPALIMAATMKRIPIVQHIRIVVQPPVQPIYTFVDAFIAISNTVQQSLARAFVPPSRTHLVYNGVTIDFPPDNSACRELADLPSGPVITMAARISQQKRQDLLIQALPTIRAVVPSFTVVFAGEVYPEEFGYCRRLDELISATGCRDVVRFSGYVPAIAELYRRSDIVVLCTDQEPLGICLLEAASLGVVIIAPASGGPSEIFRDGQDALLFEPGNPAQLANCILKVLTDSALAARLAHNAAETARRYTVDRYVSGVHGVYDHLLCPEDDDSAHAEAPTSSPSADLVSACGLPAK